MPKKFHLKIFTPEKLIADTEADFAVLPAYEGEMGILYGHISCALELKEGILRYFNDGKTREFAVMGGFAQVSKNEVKIFAESAELAEEINKEREKQELLNAKNALSATEKDIDIDTAKDIIRKSIIRIKLAEKRKPR